MKSDPLRLRLAGISTPMMQGDNLSIILAGVFENADQEIDDDTGWTQDAINGTLEVLDAIHDHYARALLDAHQRGRDESQVEIEQLKNLIHSVATAMEETAGQFPEEAIEFYEAALILRTKIGSD